MLRKIFTSDSPSVWLFLAAVVALLVGIQFALTALFGVSQGVILAVFGVVAVCFCAFSVAKAISRKDGLRETLDRISFTLAIGIMIVAIALTSLELVPGWVVWIGALAVLSVAVRDHLETRKMFRDRG